MKDDFKQVSELRYWTQKVLPAVYDDSLSYSDLLYKVIAKLNDLIENNSLLPDYISKLIQEYISSGAIGEVVRDILTNFMLNVKNPPNDLKPAVGDGTEDDTVAIQGCIDYASANGGMCVYFPSGTYLTKPLVIKDNVSLFGFDRYTTKLVLRGGATTSMLTGNVVEFSITGMTLDGNMDVQTNNVNVIDMNLESAIFSNMVLTDGYKLIRVTVNKILQLDNIIFDYSVIKHMELAGSGSVSASNVYMHDISSLKGECLMELQNNNSTFSNMFALGDTPLGYKIAGNNNSIVGVIKNAITPYIDSGSNNSINVLGVTENKKMTGDYTFTGNNSKETVQGKKTINADELILNPTKPIDYKEPVHMDEYFNTIPFKHGNENYDVLVKGEYSVKAVLDRLNDESAELRTGLEKEITDRTDSDTVLVGKIATERAERITMGELLGAKIDTETATRQEEVAEINSELLVLNNVYVNVKSYGVKGDGVTDDTLKIQAVIDNNVGKTIFFPQGTYMVSGIKLITNTVIMGSHFSNTTIKLINNANKDVFSNKDVLCNTVNINNIAIHGNKTQQLGGSGIKLVGNAIRIKDVLIDSCYDDGINLSTIESNVVPNPILSQILNCGIARCGKNGIVNGVPDVNINGTFVVTNGLLEKDKYDGIVANSAVKIVNCHVWGVQDGVGHRYALNLNSAGNLVSNSHFEGATTSNTRISQYGNIVTNCYMYYSFGAYNVLFVGGTYNRLSNNHLTGGASEGFECSVKLSGTGAMYNMICDNIYGGNAPAVDMGGSTGYNVVTGTGGSNVPTQAVINSKNTDIVSVIGNYTDGGTVLSGFAPTYSTTFPACPTLTQMQASGNVDPTITTTIVLSDTCENITFTKFKEGSVVFVMNNRNEPSTITPLSGHWIGNSTNPYTIGANSRVLFWCGGISWHDFKFAN